MTHRWAGIERILRGIDFALNQVGIGLFLTTGEGVRCLFSSNQS